MSLSPLYTGFGEALAGAASMRGYGAQRYFMGRQVVAVTRNQQVGSRCLCVAAAVLLPGCSDAAWLPSQWRKGMLHVLTACCGEQVVWSCKLW